jgi:8-oxo-dGTP pyrophosphatase MutT (NUDIX family)
MTEFEKKLKASLEIELPYPERMPLIQGTPASVLALFGFSSSRGNQPELLMTQRTEIVEKHKGQMAFPGGAADPNEDRVQTALRETEEEVGISPSKVSVFGHLPGLWTPTGFSITPIVGVLKSDIDETHFKKNEPEIAEVFWIPLTVLLDSNTYRREFVDRGGIRYATHVYQVGPYRIWGATGAMIKNLLDRLAAFP